VDSIQFYNGLEEVKEQADLIIANIVYPILITLLENIKSHLKPLGICLLSGILLEEREAMENQVRNHGLEIIDSLEKQDFILLKVQKRV
jgi:ribosomal protein L11 methyltransferase